MIPALLGLRAALDQAIEILGPLEPVIEAWTSSQKNGALEAAAAPEGTPTTPDEPASPDGAPGPIESPSKPPPGLFDPIAPVRRSTNGASSPSIGHCAVCDAEITQAARGARRVYCGAACRKAAKAERMAPTNGHGLLPDEVERPFRALAVPDDARSDPAALRPPALSFGDEPA
jgi:hypothetical protein